MGGGSDQINYMQEIRLCPLQLADCKQGVWVCVFEVDCFGLTFQDRCSRLLAVLSLKLPKEGFLHVLWGKALVYTTAQVFAVGRPEIGVSS